MVFGKNILLVLGVLLVIASLLIGLFIMIIQAGSDKVISVITTRGPIASETYDDIISNVKAELSIRCTKQDLDRKCTFWDVGSGSTTHVWFEYRVREGESVFLINSMPKYPFVREGWGVESDHKRLEMILLSGLGKDINRADRLVRNLGAELRTELN